MGQYYIYIIQFIFYVLFILIPMLKMRKTLKEKEELLHKQWIENSQEKCVLLDKINDLTLEIDHLEARVVSLNTEREMLKENFIILKDEIYGKNK